MRMGIKVHNIIHKISKLFSNYDSAVDIHGDWIELMMFLSSKSEVRSPDVVVMKLDAFFLLTDEENGSLQNDVSYWNSCNTKQGGKSVQIFLHSQG